MKYIILTLIALSHYPSNMQTTLQVTRGNAECTAYIYYSVDGKYWNKETQDSLVVRNTRERQVKNWNFHPIEGIKYKLIFYTWRDFQVKTHTYIY